MLISKTAFGESVYRSVVLDGYCHLDLFMTFRKLSSNLNEVTSKMLRDLPQFFLSSNN